MSRVKKSQPSASSVHVDSPMGSMEWFQKEFDDSFVDDSVEPTAPAAPSVSTPRSEESQGPDVANLEVEILKAAYGIHDDPEPYGPNGSAEDNSATLGGLQNVVSGIDHEIAGGHTDQKARDRALSKLEKNPNHYSDGESEGLNLDLGSGDAREPGYLGIDLYPHDHGTIVHDLNLGIPVADGSAQNVRLVNALEHMEMEDPSPLLSEVQRVLKPGGKFTYEGPDEIYDHTKWGQQYPGMMLVNHEETKEPVKKDGSTPWVRQQFKRLPDPATANDAYPAVGISDDDALFDMDFSEYQPVGKDDEEPDDEDIDGDFDEEDVEKGGPGSGPHPGQGGGKEDHDHKIKQIEQKQKKLEEHKKEYEKALAKDPKGVNAEHYRENINSLHDTIGELGHDLAQATHERNTSGRTKKSDQINKSSQRRVATIAVRYGDELLMGRRRDNELWTVPGGHANEGETFPMAAVRELMEETGIQADVNDLEQVGPTVEASVGLTVQPYCLYLEEKPKTTMLSDPDGEVYRWKWVDISEGLPWEQANAMHVPLDRNCLMKAIGIKAKVEKVRRFIGREVPVKKADAKKQVVYCVVLSPEELDAQDDWMTANDIEDAAHSYMLESRTIGSNHEKTIKATPVESYIAPQDLNWDSGPYGPQTVKKGAWVLGIKVHDLKEWKKVENGEYQGCSVGGFGIRD